MKQSKKPLKMMAIRLYEGDTDELKRFFPGLSYQQIVREKIHKLVLDLQAKEQERLNKLMESNTHEPATIDIDIDTGPITQG